MFRIGLGSDIHKFENGRRLVLGGVEIPFDKGLSGHSDADVVLHALGDALLGSIAAGDLGDHFPADKKNKDRNSAEILHECCKKVWDKGYHVQNIDIMVMAEEPKISKFREAMREKIASLVNVDKHCVSVKATTAETMGSVGRGEGIFAQAVVLIQKKAANYEE